MKEGTIVAVIAFPTPWPPVREILLFSREMDRSRIEVQADVYGRLALKVSSRDGPTFQRKFRALEIDGRFQAILAFTWSGVEASLHINGKAVPTDTEVDSTRLRLLGAGDTTVDERVFSNLRTASGADELERFFLNTIDDVQEKLQKRSVYSIIRASALLRQLVLDQDPLVHQVNRTYQKTLRFEILNDATELPVEADVFWKNLDPGAFPGAETIMVDLERLLSAPCLIVDGEAATVKNLIKACANAKGGVHLGGARSDGEERILDWDRSARLLGSDPSLRALAGLCRVVLRGLKPLVDAIVDRSG